MKPKKVLSILLTAVMMLGLIASMGQAVNAAGDSFDVSGSKTAAPTELDSDNRETTVTLSLPSGEYQNAIDIVFVTDSSSSTDLGTQFIESSTELFESIVSNNPNVTLKVGIVLFTGSANDAINYVSGGAYSGLTVYGDDTKELFTDAFTISETLSKDEFRNAFGRGSGPHSGLDLANQWLSADGEVEDDHKYVVLFTDGKGYIWANENHEATTIYAQYYTSNKYQLASGGLPTLSQVMGYNKMSYSVDVLDKSGKSNIVWFSSYEELYNSTNPELTGTTEYDQPCLYAYGDTWQAGMPTGGVVQHEVTNGEELFGTGSSTYGYHDHYRYWFEYTPDPAWAGIKYQEANPFEVIQNEDGTYTFDVETVNPDYYQYHVDNLQKGIYMAGHLWANMGASYHTAVITYDSSTGGGLELVKPFKQWLRSNSEYSANKSDVTQVEALFEGIDNSIRYMVSKGVVTDQITEEFTLKNPDTADGFRMTLTGETLAVAFEDGKWNFGTANEDGVYPYVVEYDESSKTITWTLNVPIENVNPVTLSYDLIIDENAESGFYDTNVSAVLDYTSTDGTRDGTFTFEIPKVSYIKLIDISVMKIWQDVNDQDGKRPETLAVSLMDGEETIQSASLVPETQWTATFVGVPDSKLVDGEIQPIEYTVLEDDVEGYEGAVAASETGGFIITNTHDPETIDVTVEKVWEDNENQDGKRPESVKVQLYAGETAVGDPVELSEDTEWTYTWTEQYKYAAGEEIVYVVEEVDVPEGYESETSGSAAEGFVVTNSHEPETKEITVEKVWDDNDDKWGLRPDSVTVTLLSNGKTLEIVSLSKDNEWKHTFTGLDVYAEGKEISYTVTEESVEGYETSIDGLVITNKLIAPPEFTITYKLNGGQFDGKTDDILEVYPGDTVISIHEAPTREGYKFLYWEDSHSQYQPGDKYTVVEDHVFTAQWEPIPEESESSKPEEPDSKPEEPVIPPDKPKTGDNHSIGAWFTLTVSSALLCVVIFLLTVTNKKRRRPKRSH